MQVEMKKIRICHLTTVHPRSDTRILLKECESLKNYGYEVHLVVGDGEGDADINGTQVHDIGAKPWSRLERMWLHPKRAEEKIIQIRPDMVHFHDPELLPLGAKLAKKGFPVLYDAHEDVPRQILTKHWIPLCIRPLVARIFESYENRTVRCLSGVVATTPHITQRFAEQGVRTVNVNNYPIPEELAPISNGVSRHKRVCYIGALSRMRGVLQMIRALPLVPDVRLTLCGNFGEADLESEVRKEPGWEHVDYLGHVDRSAARSVMAESFAGIVTYLPAPNHVDAQPNKLFEYMSAELPVIASGFPLWQQIIDSSGCGLCVDPNSPDAIAGAIRILLDEPREAERMGRAGRQAVLKRYNWPVEAQKLIALYKALL
jgi:hypothetical protein